MWILPSRPDSWLAMPAPATHAAELIRFSTGHKPPGFADGLLLPGVCVAQQYHDACAENLFALSKAFFLNALAPLGVKIVAEGEPGYGVELCPDRGNVSLCLFQTDEKPAHLHLAFAASSREQVDAFYHAALNAGGIDNGAPGLRPNYHAHYYAAFVIAPDGHNIEAVCHNPMS